MALNWNWTDRMGSVIYDDGSCDVLYKGNAYIIAIRHNDEDNTYNLTWFAADKDHLKNMLGLTKGYDCCMNSFGIESIELNGNYKHVREIVDMIMRSKWRPHIRIYY